MEKKWVKQVVGIDVAQNELVVCIGRMGEDLTPELYGSKTFENTSKGFVSLLSWVGKMTVAGVSVRYVMEATGVYHESFAYFLADKGCSVSIVLPNRISNYFRTLEVKTVTDKTSSEAITLFGLERKLEDWQRPKPVYKRLRQLTREREQLIAERTMVKNQLHAEKAEAEPGSDSIKRMEKRIQLFNQQEKEIKSEIAAMSAKDPEVKAAVKLITSIPGIGVLTAVAILAETNGFDLIRNKRQLTSYAGLDVREKQSGTSVKGKSKISKRGNKYLRKALHMPSLSTIQHDERFKAIYARIIARNGIKMKALVAVQRRLLEMTYTIFKTGTPYDKNYFASVVQKN